MREYKKFDINDTIIFNVDWFPAKKGTKGIILSFEPLNVGVIYCIELNETKKKIYLHNSESWIINKI